MIKCLICEKKIKTILLDIYKCRCKNIYCVKHLHDHNCDFDYKKLLEIGDEVINTKIMKI